MKAIAGWACAGCGERVPEGTEMVPVTLRPPARLADRLPEDCTVTAYAHPRCLASLVGEAPVL